MFKNNCYSLDACNYSFCEDEDKQNISSISNINTSKDPIMAKLDMIEKIMNRHLEVEMENRKILKQQSQAIAHLEKAVGKISKNLGIGVDHEPSSKIKSESLKTCRTKRSMEKNGMNCIEERKKIINEELSRRINDQLDPRAQKKPLRFFMPSQL